MRRIASDVLWEFETWFDSEAATDSSYFAGITPQQLIEHAAAVDHKCLDDLLNLPRGRTALREWIAINLVQLDSGNPFPTMRRKGGDHDRGFSPALNAEMKQRYGSGE